MLRPVVVPSTLRSLLELEVVVKATSSAVSDINIDVYDDSRLSVHTCITWLVDVRDHFVNAPSQWETTLHCNVVSHWLGAYTKWSRESDNGNQYAASLFHKPSFSTCLEDEKWNCLSCFCLFVSEYLVGRGWGRNTLWFGRKFDFFCKTNTRLHIFKC